MKAPKAPPVVSDINVTPMVDVMLVVLIIFMVITPMLSKGQNVDMAKARNTRKMVDADREDAVMVAVTRDGKIFLSPGNTQMSLENLPTRVKDLQTVRTSDVLAAIPKARFTYWRCFSSRWWWAAWRRRPFSGASATQNC